jgi:2-O-methyltransferase
MTKGDCVTARNLGWLQPGATPSPYKRERLVKKALNYIKKRLSPSVKGPIREILNRAGLMTTRLTHETIATLVSKPNPIILEIGCNDGSDTLAFLRVMPEAKICCFEPDPRAIARFKKHLGTELNKVKLFEIAISDRTGTIDFHTSGGNDLPEGWNPGDLIDGWDQSGSIHRPKNHLKEYPWVKFEKIITVGTRGLDDWCAENGVHQVDFIWMDVQGAEGEVITGASNILRNTRFLYTEYSDKETYEGQPSLKGLLARLPSFEIIARYPQDVLLRNRNL